MALSANKYRTVFETFKLKYKGLSHTAGGSLHGRVLENIFNSSFMLSSHFNHFKGGPFSEWLGYFVLFLSYQTTDNAIPEIEYDVESSSFIKFRINPLAFNYCKWNEDLRILFGEEIQLDTFRGTLNGERMDFALIETQDRKRIMIADSSQVLDVEDTDAQYEQDNTKFDDKFKDRVHFEVQNVEKENL